MIWRHLKAEIARLERAGLLTDWTETGIDGLTVGPWGLVLDTEADADLAAQLEDRAAEVKTLEEAAKLGAEQEAAAETRAAKAEEEADALREEMAAIRDGEKGYSVADYREQAARAGKETQDWREHVSNARKAVDEMARELDAMRKRKGIEPGLMAHARDVSGFLNTVAHYGDKAQHDDRARDTLQRLGTDARRLRERIDTTANAGKPAAKVRAAA